MEFGGRPVSAACYNGCPDSVFRCLVTKLAKSNEDIQKAVDAGMSQEAIEAVTALRDPLERTAERIAQRMPGDEQTAGPWEPQTEGLPTDVAAQLGAPMCCRVSGVIGIDLGRGGNSYQITRTTQAVTDVV